MKAFKSIAVGLTLAALISGSAHPSFAAPAAVGAKCSKANAASTANGKRLVCTAKGSKLYWKAAGTVPAGNPAPAPSPSSTPVAAVFKAAIPITLPVSAVAGITFDNAAEQYANIPAAAWKNVQDAVAANQPVSIPTNLAIGPTTGTTAERVQALLSKEYQLWNGFSQPKSFTGIIHNAADTDWAFDQWVKLATQLKLTTNPAGYKPLISAGCGTDANGKVTECWGGNVVLFPDTDETAAFYGVQEPFWTSTSDQAGPVSQVVHEYDHAVQFAQWLGNPATPTGSARVQAAHNVMPCWFQEGQANAIGVPLASTSLAMYMTGRDNSVRRRITDNGSGNLPLTDTTLTAPNVTNFLLTQAAPGCFNVGARQDYQLGYGVGFAATEVLVAIGGPRSTMALQAEMASGNTWSQAFKLVYGIDWEKGAKVLGDVLAAEYAAKPNDH